MTRVALIDNAVMIADIIVLYILLFVLVYAVSGLRLTPYILPVLALVVCEKFKRKIV